MCERLWTLPRVVRGSVEATLNAALDAEADRLCNAQRYERSEARRDTRAGHYERNLQTKAGEVRLKVPKLRQQTFETAIIERYRWRESSVEEALIEMYLAGVRYLKIELLKDQQTSRMGSNALGSPRAAFGPWSPISLAQSPTWVASHALPRMPFFDSGTRAPAASTGKSTTTLHADQIEAHCPGF